MSGAMTLEQLLERVQRVWDQARGRAPLPSRAAIDPIKLGPALPHVSMLDVVASDPVDFRYRVIGEQLIKGYGLNLAGQLHTHVANPSRATWPFYEAYKSCLESRQPHRLDIRTRNRKEIPVTVQGLIFPLSDDGHTVSGLFGACLMSVPAEIAS